jgi:hypothetical protein
MSFFSGYFAGKLDKRFAGVSGVEELALYLLFAIPIDAVALAVLPYFGVHFDFLTTLHLLSAPVSERAATQLAAAMQAAWATSAMSYVAVLSLGYFVGSVLRRIVWTLRLDIRFSILRLRHSWYYALQGRLPGKPRVVVAYVDVLTEHPDGSRLYRGVVVDFEIAPSGALDSLTLQGAKRGRGRGADFDWVDIPSDRLVVLGNKIHSINIAYVGIGQEPATPWLKVKGALRTYYRSLVFQEP